MPWMPDRGPPKQPKDDHATTSFAVMANDAQVKAAETRILSLTEHLNEILNLLALLTVCAHRRVPENANW
jgi:hypothetical protein